jgi:ribosomal protein S27AE
LKKRNKEELRQKISHLKHLRKNIAFGLILGVILVILGQLGLGLAILVLGYGIILACTAAISFSTALSWLYSKTYEKVLGEDKELLPIISCPRCGAAIEKNRRYCKKCGKKIFTKKP